MIQVRSFAELLRLRHRPDRFRQQITFLIPEFGVDTAHTTGQQIRAYQRECGCSAGAVCFVAALAACTAFIAIRYGMSWAFIIRLPFALLISFVAGGIGKMSALARARRRFDRKLDLLIRTFA